MHAQGTAHQIARWTALGALFLLPFTPLVVSNGYFFPFITGKAFYLRILIEIAVAAWVVLVFLDRSYRPRFSWLGVSAIAFVGWMFIADSFAINSTKAFWSNFERMEGWVLLVHLLGFFYAAGAVLRVGQKWRAWFLTSLAVSLIISIYALGQLGGVFEIHQGSTRVDATLGNSAYLAIYLLFSFFVALWLALTEKHNWLKRLLILLAVLEGVLIFFTETRGTIVGFTLGCAVAALLTAVTGSARTRRYALGALAFIVVLVGSFSLVRNSDFVQGNHVLQRVASISLESLGTRLTIWRMAGEGLKERPLLGWGQEGFNYVFNKYYDPSLFKQEQWFDRAHNAFLDWLMAGGIPAFLLYIGLFGTALWLLWRSPDLSRSERTLLTAALVGYAVHNLFVFDNLYSYIYFFAILALIDSQVGRPIAAFEEGSIATKEDGVMYALPIAGVACLGLMWFVNFSAMGTASRLITALTSSNYPDKSLMIFQQFSTRPVPQMQEIREQLVSYAGAVVQSQATTDEQKRQAATLAVQEMEKQLAQYPLDARAHVQLSYLYRSLGDNARARQALETAVTLSPKKVQFYLDKGIIEWNLNDLKAAQADFHTAYTLGPTFTDLAYYAAAGDIAVGEQETADTILTTAFGTTAVDSDVLTIAYYRAKNWPRLIGMLKARVEAPNAPVNAWFALAAAYYESGNRSHAITTIKVAVAKFPEAATSGAAAIKQIQEGK